MNLPNYYHLIGDYDTMLELSQKTLEMAPFAITAILNAGFAYSEKGLFQEASHQFQRVVELTGLGLKGLLGYSLAMAGDKKTAQTILQELQNPPEGEHIRPMQIALVLIGLKQFDQAFDWLDKSYEMRSSPFLALVRTLPMFHLLRDKPRYHNLLRRLNFQ